MNKQELIRELTKLSNRMHSDKEVLKVLIEKAENLPAGDFDPNTEYTFQEAGELAFENPGWVFNPLHLIIDESNQLKYNPKVNCYFINGYNDRFKLSPQDLKSKWHRIK